MRRRSFVQRCLYCRRPRVDVGARAPCTGVHPGLAALIVLSASLLTATTPLAADTFSFSGDRTEVVLAEGRERTLLEGNARVVSDSFTLEADEIELSGTDFRYARLRGSVRVTDGERDLVITGEELFFDRRTENSRAEGNVMVEDNENELLLKGNFLETRDGGDLLSVQVAVRVLQEDLTARAQFLRYRRQDDVLELSGFPVVFWKGDEYRAGRILLNLETEEIELQGRVRGEIAVEDDEEEDAGEDPEPAVDVTPPEPSDAPSDAPTDDTALDDTTSGDSSSADSASGGRTTNPGAPVDE